MLTTHQLVRNATSLLWPSLLVLISWYSIAASIRAFLEFGFRLYHRRRVARRLSQVTGPMMEDDAHTTPMFIPMMESRLEGLQDIIEESLLLGRKATPARIGLSFLEGFLFAALSVVALIGAKPALAKLGDVWWLHLVGVVFFMCFILRARRLLLLIPLTFLVWSSWEMFAFITSFEKTLQATSLLANVEVLEKKPADGTSKVKVKMTFKGRYPQELWLPANDELFFKGRVYRVSPEVLLFGGKNIATIDQVFSDDMKPKDAIVLLKSESVPPLYRWKDYEAGFREEVRKKFSHWLWKQFFELRETSLVKTKLLEAPRCRPVKVGQKFELRLRHVGGLECHAVDSFSTRVAPPPKKPGDKQVAPRKSNEPSLLKVNKDSKAKEKVVTPRVVVPPKNLPIKKLNDLKKLPQPKAKDRYIAPYIPPTIRTEDIPDK
ncbi:MAG: hypothetical protein CL920_30770 [Deltaproteobacteria bacterium]|nr:hypothetical protein [Deltaproteobacteria bacterium]